MFIARKARVASNGGTGRQRLVTILAALTLACTGAFVFITERTANAASCSGVMFIGVRGSGEAAGLGGTVQDAYNAFAAQNTKSVTLYALPYTAAPVPVINKGASISAFINSVNSGKTMLTDYITAQSAQCPSQNIVLAGFSQGALVIVEAMRSLPVSTLDHVTAMALIGDPAFDPKFSGNVGTYAKNDEGIVSTFTSIYKYQDYLPATVSGNAKSYCVAYDPVCNYSMFALTKCLWSTSKCSHGHYGDLGYSRQAGQFLASKV